MQKWFTVSVIYLIWGTFLGCTLFEDSAPVAYEVVEQGVFSGIHSGSEQVIKTTEQWVSLWEKHTSNRMPRPDLPDIDFANHVVIAIFIKDRPSSGYVITISTSATSDGDVAVRYQVSQPTGPVLTVLTQPFAIIKIRKPEGSIRIIAV